MSNRRFGHVDWSLPLNTGGGIRDWDAVNIALLMDIRDELKQLNSVLACHHFQAIPRTLYEISRKLTVKPKRKRKSISVNV